MNIDKQKITNQASITLMALENIKPKVVHQVNRHHLLRINEIVKEIENGNFTNVQELKGIVVNNTPESSDHDNDIFSINAKAGGGEQDLGNFLWDLIRLVEKYADKEVGEE